MELAGPLDIAEVGGGIGTAVISAGGGTAFGLMARDHMQFASYDSRYPTALADTQGAATGANVFFTLAAGAAISAAVLFFLETSPGGS